MQAQYSIQLTQALSAWQSDDFEKILQHEIEELDPALLPLQQALSQGNYVADDKFNVMVIHVSEDPALIHVKTGIFYKGVIAGCSCADDPAPVDSLNEYCELLFDINKRNAETTVTLLSN